MILFYFTALVAAQTRETPKAFIERIYAGYADENYSPFKQLEAIFAPGLVAAIREDARLAKGEVGYLDSDPLCDCQDYLRIGAQIRNLKQPTKRSAFASMHISYGNGEAEDLRLKLILTRSGWRVADVASPEQASLLKSLLAANRRARGR
jgi:Protein of unknown function (DUF3828)